MGKGQIFAHLGDGKYSVTLNYKDTDRIDLVIAELEDQISEFENQVSELEDGEQKDKINLKIAALQKMIDWYIRFTPKNPNVKAWCVDLTEDLSGIVGTIEIPGERTIVKIRPGYDGGAEYDADRDGQLQPVISAFPANFFLNLAIFPGWQTHKPTYRIGRIIADSINYNENTCSVCLSPAFSSQGNINVNPDADWSECPATPPSGYDQFCTDNPTHPICTNTTVGNPLQVSAGMYDTLNYYQNKVNSEHEYENDKSGYGIGDYWAIMGAGDKGDCEDMVLTKMDELINDGWSPSNLQIATCYTEGGSAHAVLLIRTKNRGNLILDNRYDKVKTQESLPYQWINAQRAGNDWSNYSVSIEDIPIEYMTCNAAAFADGDTVIVEFSDQDSDDPKVIGFYSNPQPCTGYIICALGTYAGTFNFTIAFDAISDSWTLQGNPLDSGYIWARATALTYASRGWVFGGTQRHYTAEENILVKQTKSFNIILGGWTSRQSFPSPARAYLTCFEVGGKGYLVSGTAYPGGFDYARKSAIYDDVDEYNFLSDAWTIKGDDLSRWLMEGFAAGGNGFVCGGRTNLYYNPTVQIASNRKYNAINDSWSNAGSLPIALGYHGTFNAAGYGYTLEGIGGDIQDGLEINYKNFKYDHIGNSWSQKAKRNGTGVIPKGAKTGIFQKGYVYDVGDQKVHEYNPATNTWSAGAFQNDFYGGDGVCFSA